MKFQAPSAKSQIDSKHQVPDPKPFGIWNLACSPRARPCREFGILQRAGFTLLETLVAIAIIVLLAVFITSGLMAFRASAALDEAADGALSLLREARSNVLGSEGASSYGVHFAATSLTLFKGGSYSAGASANVVVTLPSSVSASAISLSTTTANVVFERLTGESKATGTVTFLSSRSGKTRQIRILPAGLFQTL